MPSVEDMLSPGERRRLAAQRAVEDRAFQAEQWAAEERADAARQRAEFSAHEYIAQHGRPRPSALEQALAAGDGVAYDRSQPAGSEANPVILY